MSSIHKIIATAFGAGYSPFAPGTAGALVGLLIWWGAGQALGERPTFPWLMLGATLLVFLLGVWSADALEKEWGKDPSRVVADEVVGMWISLLWVPLGWPYLLTGFILFRIFDIWKPLYVRSMERLPGGWGVMMDDVLAGIYANLVLQVLIHFHIL
ncbi:MAG: phosphatidylglycerophosphatase A [Bacteroidota bacterium]